MHVQIQVKLCAGTHTHTQSTIIEDSVLCFVPLTFLCFTLERSDQQTTKNNNKKLKKGDYTLMTSLD